MVQFGIRFISHWVGLLALLVFLGNQAESAADEAYNWPTFPHPDVIHVTQDLDGLSSCGAGDPGGMLGDLSFMLHSVSGLAALSAADGAGHEMVWLLQSINESYRMWLGDVLRLTGAKSMPANDPWELVRHFREKGAIKGYVLYTPERSKREFYAEDSELQPGYDSTINVATTAAPFLRAILVTPALEAKAREMGLTMLLDARGKTEQWAFEKYSAKANRNILHVIDPKTPHCRDFSIASRSICIFGRNETSRKIMAWCEPNSPVSGWNAGDEYKQTLQMSEEGLYQTASNWSINLPVLSSLRPGKDVSWDAMRLNRRSDMFMLELDWPVDTHYTSFVMTDGDNLQWFMGGFYGNAPSYWASPARGEVEIGWTAPIVSLAKACLPALAYTAATQSSRDHMLILGGEGYYYPEFYGTHRASEAGALFLQHLDRMKDYLARIGIRVAMCNNFTWDSPAAHAGYKGFAEKVPSLSGLLAIQYSPYNAGLGKMLWVKNASGDPLPVISAKYALWNNQTQLELNGPPAMVASWINEAQYKGYPDNENYFDWTTVHCWSFFKEAALDAAPDAEEVEQARAKEENAKRGAEPILWTARRLAPHVRVVDPEELLWRTRLALRTRETLAALTRDALANPAVPTVVKEQLETYRSWLATAPLETFEQKKVAMDRLRDLRMGKFSDSAHTIY